MGCVEGKRGRGGEGGERWVVRSGREGGVKR
jgi:hypothetical protein